MARREQLLDFADQAHARGDRELSLRAMREIREMDSADSFAPAVMDTAVSANGFPRVTEKIRRERDLKRVAILKDELAAATDKGDIEALNIELNGGTSVIYPSAAGLGSTDETANIRIPGAVDNVPVISEGRSPQEMQLAILQGDQKMLADERSRGIPEDQKRELSLGEAAYGGLGTGLNALNRKLGEYAYTGTGLAQLVKNLVTQKHDYGMIDWAKKTFIDDPKLRYKNYQLKPDEKLGFGGELARGGAQLAPMFLDAIFSTPRDKAKKFIDTGKSVIERSGRTLTTAAPTSVQMTETLAKAEEDRLVDQGMPRQDAQKAAQARYKWDLLAFGLPITGAGGKLSRMAQGGGSTVVLEAEATIAENKWLSQHGYKDFEVDPLDPTRLTTTAVLGSGLGLALGQRLSPRSSRANLGYDRIEPRIPVDLSNSFFPADGGDGGGGSPIADAVQNIIQEPLSTAGKVERAEDITHAFRKREYGDSTDPVIISRESVVPDPEARELIPITKEGEPEPVTDRTGTIRTDPEALARSREAEGDAVKEEYLKAGLDPEAQARAFARKDLPEDVEQDIRTVKGELDDYSVGLIQRYMDIEPVDLRKMGANAQRRLLSKAMLAKAEDARKQEAGTFAAADTSGEGLTSPPRKPQVPGDRSEVRSEYEDPEARLAGDAQAADIADLRARAADGDKDAIKELRGREKKARKTAPAKAGMIDKLDAMRTQSDLLRDNETYKMLRRMRDVGWRLSVPHKKLLDTFDSQAERLKSSITRMEDDIYAIEPKADLGSTTTVGGGARPFRRDLSEGGKKAEEENIRLGEYEAAKAEDDLINEWKVRAEMREQSRRAEGAGARQAEPEYAETGKGTAKAKDPVNGDYETNPDGFVKSTNEEPIWFDHQRGAAKWILGTGNKNAKDQIFEIHNHPSGDGFTVRMTARTEAKRPPPGGFKAKPSEGEVAIIPGEEKPKGSDEAPETPIETIEVPTSKGVIAEELRQREKAKKEEPAAGKPEETALNRQAAKLEQVYTDELVRAMQLTDFAPGKHDTPEQSLENARQHLTTIKAGDIEARLARIEEQAKAEYFKKYTKRAEIAVAAEKQGKRMDPEALRKETSGVDPKAEKKRVGKIQNQLINKIVVAAREAAATRQKVKNAYAEVKETLAREDPEGEHSSMRAVERRVQEVVKNDPDKVKNLAKAVLERKESQLASEARYKKANRVGKERDLLQSIRSWGGIDPYYRSGIVGENKGFGNTFREGGLGMDRITALMREDGFLGAEGLDTATTKAEDNASDMIRQALDGEKILNAEDQVQAQGRQENTEFRDHLLERVKDENIKTPRNPTFMSADQLSEVVSKHDAAKEAAAKPVGNESVEHLQGLLDRTKGHEKLTGEQLSNLLNGKNGVYIATHKALGQKAAFARLDAKEEVALGQKGKKDERTPAEKEYADDLMTVAYINRLLKEEIDLQKKAPAGEEFNLKGQKQSDLDQQNQREAAERARQDQELKDIEKDKGEADVRDRMEGANKKFKLGEDGEKNLSGQEDLGFIDAMNKASDDGTLFSNPFHKVLGWAFGDGNQWTDRMTVVAKSLRDIGKSRDINIFTSPVSSFFNAVFASSSAAMRSVVRRHGKSDTARWVVDQFHVEAGSGRAVGEVYNEALQRKVFGALNKMHRLLGRSIHDEKYMNQLAKLLRSGKAIKGTKVGDDVAAIRKMLDDELKYLRDAGVEVGEVEHNYFPREYRTSMIADNGQQFMKAASQAYRETGLRPEAATAAAKLLHDQIVFGEHGQIFKSRGGASSAPFLKGRVFGKNVDLESHPLNKFLNNDTAEVLTSYFQRSARRAEISRRFGDNFSHWNDYRDAGGKAQDGILTKIEKENGGDSVERLQEYIALAAGIRSPNISHGAMQASSIARTWGALMFLEKATISSLTEIIVPSMRSGNILDLGRSLTDAVGSLLRTGSAKERRAFAEDLGLIAGHIDSALSVARFAGGDPISKFESHVLDSFFKRTGLTQWTDLTRVISVDIARVFVRRLAKGDAGKFNNRQLADLGIPAEKVEAFKKFVRESNDGMPQMEQLKGEMGDLYRVAMSRFTFESIMSPTATTKPRWMTSSPLGSVVGQLQSFNYGFYENVIKRMGRMSRDAFTESGYTTMERAKMLMPMVISPLLIAGAYAINEGRDKLLGYDPKLTPIEKGIRAWSRGMPIAPVEGVVNFASSYRYRRSFAQSAAGPVLGAAAQALDKARDLMLRNTARTNTAERAAAKSVYDVIIEPTANMLLFATPVRPAYVIATQVLGSGATREKFVELTAGQQTSRRR